MKCYECLIDANVTKKESDIPECVVNSNNFGNSVTCPTPDHFCMSVHAGIEFDQFLVQKYHRHKYFHTSVIRYLSLVIILFQILQNWNILSECVLFHPELQTEHAKMLQFQRLESGKYAHAPLICATRQQTLITVQHTCLIYYFTLKSFICLFIHK